MGWFNTMMQALSTGWNTGLQAARRVYEDPETSYQEQNFVNRAMQYHLLWAYYNNSMFEKLPRLVHNLQPWGLYNPWQVYRSNYNLYRDIRMIYNPTTPGGLLCGPGLPRRPLRRWLQTPGRRAARHALCRRYG